MAERNLKSEIDEILAARQRLLPQVNDAIAEASKRGEGVDRLLALVGELSDIEQDDDDRRRVHHAIAELGSLRSSLEHRLRALETLRSRYSRDTINIGVSGEARVGKSTTLQRFSGLTNTQIPAGDGLPVTAVRSEIFNSSDQHADVTFRDQASFIAEYIQPLLTVVNKAAPHEIAIRNLSELRTVELPHALGNNVDSVTADSLRRLKDAQRSLDSYANYLTGRVDRISLGELRKFVAYPTNDQIRSEENGGQPASRAYIAVRDVKIYCKFPSLDGVKIGLVDLPGLGEIGDAVANMHLTGLEDGVDQVFLIMRPTESEGYVKAGISSNIDQLRRIQPGIKRRADLITAGINVYDGLDQTAQTLEDDFRRSINGAQKSDTIQIERYQAIDSDSVAGLFDLLLAKISKRLPVMDQEVFDYVMAEDELHEDLSSTLGNLSHTLNQVLKRIPLEERWLAQQIERVSKSLKDDYNRYEVELAQSAKNAGEWSRAFAADVQRLHADTSARIKDGYFLGRDRWQESARGQTDYYIFYREEARRLRREIIAQYSGLDEFYEDHVNRLKSNVVDILLHNTGNLRETFGIAQTDDAESRIDKIASELSGSIRDDDLDSALELLKSVQFSFRHNVFLNISEHLESLANPEETHKVRKDTYENIRGELGGIADIDTKTTKLSTYLAAIAHDANNRIRDALLASDDRFGEYLSVCMSFFIDYLYRKDDDNFTHFIVRRLISVYRDFILTDTSSVVSDQAKTALIGRIKVAIRAAADGSTSSGVDVAHALHTRQPQPIVTSGPPDTSPVRVPVDVPETVEPARVLVEPAPALAGLSGPTTRAATRHGEDPEGPPRSPGTITAAVGGFRSNISFGRDR